jgi:hypothetical protein
MVRVFNNLFLIRNAQSVHNVWHNSQDARLLLLGRWQGHFRHAGGPQESLAIALFDETLLQINLAPVLLLKWHAGAIHKPFCSLTLSSLAQNNK